jgi:hypothetical protein
MENFITLWFLIYSLSVGILIAGCTLFVVAFIVWFTVSFINLQQKLFNKSITKEVNREQECGNSAVSITAAQKGNVKNILRLDPDEVHIQRKDAKILRDDIKEMRQCGIRVVVVS